MSRKSLAVPEENEQLKGVYLSTSDWEEIAAAVELRAGQLQKEGPDSVIGKAQWRTWIEQLKNITRMIGPDGEEAVKRGVCPVKRTALEFNALKVVEISTSNITRKDGALILDNLARQNHAPYVTASSGLSTWFRVPGEEDDTWEFTLAEHGFSKHFIRLFRNLRVQGKQYVCFDPDASVVIGAPTFDW
jgi:hypothetical protein